MIQGNPVKLDAWAYTDNENTQPLPFKARFIPRTKKIEELILMFATHATGVLKKEPSLAGDGWKFELNNQIAQFIKLLRECLRNVNHVSQELLSRLDTYTAKLTDLASRYGDGRAVPVQDDNQVLTAAYQPVGLTVLLVDSHTNATVRRALPPGFDLTPALRDLAQEAVQDALIGPGS